MTTSSQKIPALDKYNAWVLENESLARRLENVFYVVPMLVPARVGNPDVVSEVGYSMGGLLKLYHDYLLYRAVHPEETPRTLVQAARVPLSLLAQVQVAAEIIALKTGGSDARWRVIVALEICKCVCKLALLGHAKGQVLYKNGTYITCEVPATESKKDATEYTGQRSGRVFKSHREAGQSSQEPLTLSFVDATVASGHEGPLQLTGEILHILRPVVYAVLCQRKSEQSWVPFLASFSTEVLGLLCSSAEAPTKATPAVTEEFRRRKMCLFLYLLRNPLFSSVTNPLADSVANATQPVPVLGRLIQFAIDNGLLYYQRRHFYTSAS
ncbi:hypothetical protein SPRG_00847 [Saprolegnia parasitica CBS 223.65]|uniref:Peroxisomal membrane protein PEX16 n=1 Tax=Saprolegnia parasitica (strain CBS 223.65) TaxID=695850 RepID=A0A067D809_SAPPC|nr:hypothetical protein SPRG_00847 [Saprolegnia parasitica CBS 223.65]KDO34786.1 hypothetical protein SPRG_00847 [Saprolegnia parasitica CBS 223.65]|eukprot:XP_012194453.1 hypothetical protein SPRG_00847 [Saprolegnia parasitica CBS 223.65]